MCARLEAPHLHGYSGVPARWAGHTEAPGRPPERPVSISWCGPTQQQEPGRKPAAGDMHTCLWLSAVLHSCAGKVHGSLARAGKVRGQTPKVPKQEKKKNPKGRAMKRIKYNRRFVNVGEPGSHSMKGGGGVDRQCCGKQLEVAAAPCSACGQEGLCSGMVLALAVLALTVLELPAKGCHLTRCTRRQCKGAIQAAPGWPGTAACCFLGKLARAPERLG